MKTKTDLHVIYMCRPKLQFRPMTMVTEPTETFGKLLVKKVIL